MADFETDSILDRISKLLAKAKGTSNEHEAEVFAAKAAELLAKHNLDEEMLRQRDADREQGPIDYHAFTQRVPDAWRERIVIGVGKLYFCKVIFTKGDARSYRFIGREHNAKVAMLMAEYLFATVKRMAREYSTERRIQANYRKGAGDRLYNRLLELAAAQRDATRPEGAGGTALMILDEDGQLEAFINNAGVKTVRGKGHKHGAGSSAGWDDAGKISLNTQVRERRANRMLSN